MCIRDRHFAAEMGHGVIIEALCAAGADANAPKTTGGTPLHTAADCNQPRAISALLAAGCGARPSALLNKDTSPLYLAAQRGFVEACAALLDGGADVNFAMPQGGAPADRRRGSARTLAPLAAGGPSLRAHLAARPRVFFWRLLLARRVSG
eukprot:6562449-Prymnesium_polylepis.1